MKGSQRPLVVDADGHVIEPPQLWAEYLEPRFRRRAPRPQRDENGKFGYVVDDRYLMRTASSLAARPKTEDGKLPTGGLDPQQRLRDIDLQAQALHRRRNAGARSPSADRRPRAWFRSPAVCRARCAWC